MGRGTIAAMDEVACDSCGRDDEPTTEVRRIYITPAAWDTEEKVTKAPDTELWCDVCRTHYPHEGPDAA
ncbi:MAG: hypothetical protein AAF962_06895 [Actinomycetota bacterium]